ncbi:MAG: FG-GAP-like repeat-containing protein, partial [bacterium]
MRIIALILLFGINFTTHAQITSTFDTNADGWTFLNSATPITPNHSTTGGNPAGFISAAYSASVGTSTQSWIAPAKFLGSQVLRSMDMNLRFDLQQSQAGTNSNANGDVRIESTSIRLVYSLPVKPAVAPGWSSYSLKLDEIQGWRLNNTTGAFATRTQIIAVLSNITAIEIRGTYATNATYTSGIDNVILEQRTLSTSPTITSFAPTSGEPGTVLNITGTSFDTTPNNNAVYFGSIAGTITSASATQLSVTIPIGASHGPITVINKTTGASKRSEKPFNPTFTEGGRIIPASLKPRFDILLDPIAGNDLNGLATADLDGDGWNDLLVTESSINTVSIFRNLGLGGDLSISSFGSKLSLTGAGNRSGVFTVDLDGDGKLDVVTAYVSSPFEYFATYRNVSTTGNLSFESVELWQAVAGNSSVSAVVDIDGDGRPDLIGQTSTGSVSADFWIAQNISTPGNIEFGASIAYFGGSTLDAGAGVSSGDLDNDGKPDLIVKHSFGSLFSIIKNNSTPGTISLGTPIAFAFGSHGDINISDFNGDGKNDIAWKAGFSNDDVRIRINTNSGGALAATDFATEVILDSELTNYGGMSVADVNGDGKPDIIAADAADVGVFENNYSGGAFDANAFVSAYQLQGYSAATYPFSPVVVDLNGDKKPELILGYTNSSPKRISIFENKNVPAPVISLNTVSPLSAPVGSTVTITGNNFSTNTTDNEVWFGDVRATVLTASATQLTVTVPAGAAYAPVSVRKGELSSSYHLPFSTSFSSGVTFNATHFAPPITYTLAGADYDIEVGDLDLDGKPDVIADGTGQIPRLFQNTHASGAISGTSLTSAGAVANSAANAKLVDVDGDGKLDIVGGSGRTFPNQSTVGSILFGTEINAISGDNVTFGDLNQDGKTDLASAAFSSGSAQLILQENRSNVGTFVSSGAFGTLSTSIVYTKASRGGDVTIADFDNDGFNDVVSLNPFTDNISVFRNAQRLRVSATTFDPRVEIAVGDNPLRSYPADFDRDGKIDLLVTHWTGTSTTLLIVFQNTSTVGNISFNRIDLTNPSAVTIATVADLDGDGKPEIITTSESGNRFSIFKNLHTSGALTAASFAAPFNTTVIAPRGITTGDLNLDGKPEIILTRAAGLLVVYENLISSVSPPTITSFTPASGPIGTTVTITGTNFNTTPTNNIVIFGATAATVTAATATQLIVTVPMGATYTRITVLNATTGLLAYSSTNFTPTFTPNKGSITVCDFSPKVDFPAEPSPYSIAIGDLDGDGKADLVVGNNGNLTVSVFRNTSTGVGNISYAAKVDLALIAFPQSISIGDLDGDGKLDLAVANHQFLNNSVSIFRNTSTVGTISFAPRVTFQPDEDPSSVSIGDLDGDGKADLAVTNQLSNSVSIFRNTSTGVGNISYATKVDFTTGTAPLSVSIGDLDGDLKADLAVANNGSTSVSIFRNTSAGAGNISYAAKVDFTTGTTPRFVSVGDLDGDGKNDLSVANTGSNTVSVFRNTSTGAGNIGYDAKVDFTTGTGTAPVSVSIGDLDGDGKADLAVANSASVSIASLSILRNTSTGVGTISYAPKVDLITGINPRSVSIGDLDGDGKHDVALANGGSSSISVIRNNPNFSGDPTVTSFTPAVGPIGTSVTITGINFSPVTAENVVRFFNNRIATVTASTTTSLTVTVPAGTTTGRISVATNCSTVTSATDFTIGTVVLPTIASFTPASGPVGTTVTITGTNFSTTAANNTVLFNGTTAVVTASTATSITTTVPVDATTGLISVTLSGNTAVSATTFTVTASPIITITTQPSDFIACVGQTATFTTAA